MSRSKPPIDFPCPDCGLNCQLSEQQRALRHQVPDCKTYTRLRGKPEEFLRLALMAKGAAALHLGDAQIDVSLEARKRLAGDIIEQAHEGLKKL
jgi:hypothetical protein